MHSGPASAGDLAASTKADAVPDNAPIALSVVIATHNRLDFLKACLAALAPQAGRADIEVIVVDSCSDDEVSRQVRAEAARYGFQFIRLDEPGVSRARNAGAAAASGAWFATLDDDAVPAPDWVEGALSAIDAASPGAGVIQGRVDPLWLSTPPEKVEPRHARFLSIVTYDEEKEFIGRAHCAGANMLVNRGLHARIGGYGHAFGRVREVLVSGIDTDLVDRMQGIGGRIFYTNAFRVRHAVPPQRMTRQWVRERSLHDGRAEGKIIFTRRSAPTRLLAVVKSLTAVALLACVSVFDKQSYDLLIRRCVNVGILEHAPVIGTLFCRLNNTRRPDAATA